MLRLIFACIIVSACQTLTLVKIPLIKPSEARLHIQANQTLQLSIENQQHQLLTMLSITPEKVLIFGLTTTGKRLLSINYDGFNLHSETSSELKKSPPSELIISLLQFAYWPTDSILSTYNASYKFEETATLRNLFYNDKQIISVSYKDTHDEDRNNILDSYKARGPETGQSISIFYHPLKLQLNIMSVSVHSLATGTTP